MRRLSLILGVVFLLACASLAAIQGWMGAWSNPFAVRLEQAALFAIGWGTGVTAWLLSGHQATSCFLRKVPTAWRLWQNGVLANRFPICKYLAAGLLFTGLGVALGNPLRGLFTSAFDAGLLTGATFGLIHSIRMVYQPESDHIDFLEANQRYLNEENISLFSEDWP